MEGGGSEGEGDGGDGDGDPDGEAGEGATPARALSSARASWICSRRGGARLGLEKGRVEGGGSEGGGDGAGDPVGEAGESGGEGASSGEGADEPDREEVAVLVRGVFRHFKFLLTFDQLGLVGRRGFKALLASVRQEEGERGRGGSSGKGVSGCAGAMVRVRVFGDGGVLHVFFALLPFPCSLGSSVWGCGGAPSAAYAGSGVLPAGFARRLPRSWEAGGGIFASQVLLDNGILQLTLSKPEGIVTGIRYHGVDNLMEVLNQDSNRGYWDVVWNEPGGQGIFDVIKGTDFRVILEDENQVEVSFTRTWDSSLLGKVIPINIDKRFVVLRGCSGFYTYAIYEHMEGWPDFNLGETRVAFKLRKDKFQYMAMADDRQRVMPFPDDRMPRRSQRLAYAEAVLLTNPINPELKGEVDDKYQYSCDNKDNKVHGWVSFNPPIGFWQITPSDEFRSGGPVKQNLTSHVGPTTLAIFLSSHYAGEDLVPKFRNGEYWKKVFGPVFIYLNSTMEEADPLVLWEDAKIQMQTEVESWPYSFPVSEDFPKADQRGCVSGRLLVRDRYLEDADIPADSAYVGLALPGDAGSWQKECKGYQFWARANADGFFSISNIRAGDYNLYAWVPGFIGDYKYDADITIIPGSDIELGDLLYEPPRDGPTLWEIGIPDRSAAEFYIPDPNPIYMNKLLANHPNKFRQYGLWERYAELYPDGDLVYTVGVSDYRKDWFFAQVPRRKPDNSHQGTTWQIKFKLDSVVQGAPYMLRVAIASSTLAEMQVRFNADPSGGSRAHFTTGLFGRDNSVARHGIHGLHWLFSVAVRSSWLSEGENTVFLTQPRCSGPFQGIMYDYIRFEGPPNN